MSKQQPKEVSSVTLILLSLLSICLIWLTYLQCKLDMSITEMLF